MAGGLAKPPPRPGAELFMTATDLIAAGAHTAVLSRWRMGGLTGSLIMREFLAEAIAGEPAAAAWQRAVDIVLPDPPDLAREPRLSQDAEAVLADSRHPVLWASYLLVDCGGGQYAAPNAAEPRGGPAAPRPQPPAGPAPRPEPTPPQGPMPPAILAPPPPRPQP
jgi:hypothetical protein